MRATRTPKLRRGLGLAATLAAIGLGALAPSCLPGDTRPTPGVLQVTVEPSEAVTAGLATDDGWTITFERLLVGIGGVGISGDACNNYSGGRYDRLIEATVPGQQKLAEVYGLGSCAFRFRMRTPSATAVLGEQVSDEDLAFMKAQANDAWVPIGGTSVFVRGEAAREGITKRFALHFRLGYSFHECGADAAVLAAPPDPEAEETVLIEVQSGRTRAMPVRIRGEELFRDGLAEDAGLRFGALAEADVDGDDEITWEELATLPSPAPIEDAGLADAGDADAGPPSLADFVYQVLLPRIVTVDGLGRCRADVRRNNL
jgi:hypothetical protein